MTRGPEFMRVALAGSALVIAASTGCTATPIDSAPHGASTTDPSQPLTPDGPLALSPPRTGTGSDGAALSGELVLEEDCLYIVDTTGIRAILAVARGSGRWHEDRLIVDGDDIMPGDTVASGGGFSPPSAPGIAVPSGCDTTAEIWRADHIASARPTAVVEARLSAADVLVVNVACQRGISLDLVEEDQAEVRVLITAIPYPPGSPAPACLHGLTLELQSPLGDRTVVDLATGSPVEVPGRQ